MNSTGYNTLAQKMHIHRYTQNRDRPSHVWPAPDTPKKNERVFVMTYISHRYSTNLSDTQLENIV